MAVHPAASSASQGSRLDSVGPLAMAQRGPCSPLGPETQLICQGIQEGPDPHGQPLTLQIRIWARPSAIAEGHAEYALNVTGPILSFFGKHYDTPYPLEKSGEWGDLSGQWQMGSHPRHIHQWSGLPRPDRSS